jgi:OmpA-like transmembrane domain
MKNPLAPFGCVVACAASLYALPAKAADWYAGISGGVSNADVAALKQDYSQDVPAFRPQQLESSTSSQSGGAWKALAGWKPTQFLALELSYSRYGKQQFGFESVDSAFPGSPALRTRLTKRAEREVSAWGVDVVGVWPLTPSLALQAGVGAANAEIKLTSRTRSASLAVFESTANYKENKTAARLSLGGCWAPVPDWQLRLNYEYLDKIGSRFSPSAERETGRSAHQTVWLSAIKLF